MGNEIINCERFDVCRKEPEPEGSPTATPGARTTNTKIAGSTSDGQSENASPHLLTTSDAGHQRVLSTIDEDREKDSTCSPGPKTGATLQTTPSQASVEAMKKRSELRDNLRTWNIYNSLALDDRSKFRD